MQGKCREHAWNMLATFSVNIPGTFKEHSGNMQGTHRSHAGNMQRTFSSTIREGSGHIAGGAHETRCRHGCDEMCDTEELGCWCELMLS
jgi:hypothetical protein